MIRMLKLTFINVLPFALFFILFLVFFSFCYIAIDGYTMKSSRVPGLGELGTQFFSLWRSTIGYIDLPLIREYTKFDGEKEFDNWTKKFFQLKLIWALWCV